MKTILLTGSDGFIGGYIAEELLEQGYKVVGVDNHSKYKQPSIEHHKNINFDFHHWDLIFDISDNKYLNKYNFDAIIHSAAKIGGIEYFHKYQFDLIKENALIDTNVIDFAVKKHIKLIGLSSSMVYENTDMYPSMEYSVDKISPPTSSYGFSKLTMERMIRAAHDQYGLEYSIIRPFNAVGIGENDFLEGKTSHILPDLVVKCLRGQDPLEILGNGHQIRHYTHAADIARGIRFALQNEKASLNESFNISTPISTTVFQLAEKVWNQINPKKSFRYKNITPFKYDVQKRIPSIEKAKDILGFETKISLDESIYEVINYIKGKLNV